jgi:hypothetical protein
MHFMEEIDGMMILDSVRPIIIHHVARSYWKLKPLRIFERLSQKGWARTAYLKQMNVKSWFYVVNVSMDTKLGDLVAALLESLFGYLDPFLYVYVDRIGAELSSCLAQNWEAGFDSFVRLGDLHDSSAQEHQTCGPSIVEAQLDIIEQLFQGLGCLIVRTTCTDNLPIHESTYLHSQTNNFYLPTIWEVLEFGVQAALVQLTSISVINKEAMHLILVVFPEDYVSVVEVTVVNLAACCKPEASDYTEQDLASLPHIESGRLVDPSAMFIASAHCGKVQGDVGDGLTRLKTVFPSERQR